MTRTNRRYGPHKPVMPIGDKISIAIMMTVITLFVGGMFTLFVMRMMSEVGGY